jgi:hypothetical protein
MRLDHGMDAIAGSLITAFDYVWGPHDRSA